MNMVNIWQPYTTLENFKIDLKIKSMYIIYATMTYNAKLPFALYNKHFHKPQGVELNKLYPIKIVIEFLVVEDDLDRMNLAWRCPRFLKSGILDEEKCNEIKKEIFDWIKWVYRDSFTEKDLL